MAYGNYQSRNHDQYLNRVSYDVVSQFKSGNWVDVERLLSHADLLAERMGVDRQKFSAIDPDHFLLRQDDSDFFFYLLATLSDPDTSTIRLPCREGGIVERPLVPDDRYGLGSKRAQLLFAKEFNNNNIRGRMAVSINAYAGHRRIRLSSEDSALAVRFTFTTKHDGKRYTSVESRPLHEGLLAMAMFWERSMGLKRETWKG